MALEELEKVSSPSGTGKTDADKTAKIGWAREVAEEAGKTPRSLMKFGRIGRWLFWLLIIGSLIIIAVSVFYFYQYFTVREVVLSLNAPVSASIGVPFNIEVGFQNNSDKALKDIRLSMILPEGANLLGEELEKRIFTGSFGDLDKSGSLQEKIPILILKDERSIKRFEVTISYFPSTLGPKTRLEQTKSVEVTAQESGIKLDLVAPQKVLNNENFEIEINYQNVADIDFTNVELELSYPDFFTFKNADPQPSTENNFWRIGNLTKGNSIRTLTVQGHVISGEKSFFEIKGLLKAEFLGQKYLINEKTANLNIAPSPLSLNIIVNDQPNYLAFPSTNLKYKIGYRNNSDVGLNDVIIKARLIGEMFDFRTLRSQGFFSSKDNVITWNTANTSGLRLVPPGAEGVVEFEIQTKETYPIKRVSDKNFILKVGVEISSPTVPYYVASDRTIGLAELETKVAGKIVVDSRAYFRDLASGIINQGNLPPKVNVLTNFTVHWKIINYSTDVRNIEVKAFLQSGVRWTGQVKSNISSLPTYNERTQEVVWQIDRIPATKGIISKPVEAIFQIEATPNITQIGQPMPLIGETTLGAFDEFGNIELRSNDEILTTELRDDLTVQPQERTVVP